MKALQKQWLFNINEFPIAALTSWNQSKKTKGEKKNTTAQKISIPCDMTSNMVSKYASSCSKWVTVCVHASLPTQTSLLKGFLHNHCASSAALHLRLRWSEILKGTRLTYIKSFQFISLFHQNSQKCDPAASRQHQLTGWLKNTSLAWRNGTLSEWHHNDFRPLRPITVNLVSAVHQSRCCIVWGRCKWAVWRHRTQV